MFKDRINRIYKDNLDMTAIADAVQPELDRQSQTILTAFRDMFPIIASPSGIMEWEEILNITVDPAEETIDFRRERIMNRLANRAPYTERTLQELLDRVGTSYTLDYRNYKLDVYMNRPSRNWEREVTITLSQMIPANIMWEIHLSYPIWRTLEGDYYLWHEVEDKFDIWREIEEDYEDG